MAAVLDSGGVSFLGRRSRAAAAFQMALVRRGHWPPVVPTAVVVEALSGRADADANANRLLELCHVLTELPLDAARRAAALRHRARRGSGIDAIVVAVARPGDVVLTGDLEDIAALAAHAPGVAVERV